MLLLPQGHQYEVAMFIICTKVRQRLMYHVFYPTKELAEAEFATWDYPNNYVAIELKVHTEVPGDYFPQLECDRWITE